MITKLIKNVKDWIDSRIRETQINVTVCKERYKKGDRDGIYVVTRLKETRDPVFLEGRSFYLVYGKKDLTRS